MWAALGLWEGVQLFLLAQLVSSPPLLGVSRELSYRRNRVSLTVQHSTASLATQRCLGNSPGTLDLFPEGAGVWEGEPRMPSSGVPGLLTTEPDLTPALTESLCP